MSRRGNDMAQKSFGMLTTVRKLKRRSKAGDVYWLFDCDCGRSIEATASQVKNGATYNCGCMRGAHLHKHGYSFTREYVAWSHMKERCTNKRNKDFHSYGGRGIKVCSRWVVNGFELFFADMGTCPAGMSLERKDVNGDYTPFNCIWANQETQQNNRRNNVKYVVEGVKLSIAQLARKYNFTYACLSKRLRRGYTIIEALDNSCMQRKRSGF